MLTAYGGYAISLVPRFDPETLLWLEQGGVLVVANIRGGGEYGEEWHHAGRLATKQNCFDDFIACADHLVETGVTSRDRLAIIGGSNGGLLMGAVLTQRPDIAAAVVAAVPVLDSLRCETTHNGAFNMTEFGTVEDPEIFKALLAYSPYHNVQDGTDYPAVLLHGRRVRPAGRRLARQEDDRPAAGRDLIGPAGPAAHGVRRSPVRLARPDRRGDDRHLRLLVRPARPGGHAAASFRWLSLETPFTAGGFEAQAWRPSHLNHRSAGVRVSRS